MNRSSSTSPLPIMALHSRRGGFTLLEVLTVIGIIVLLISIAAVAYSVVGRNAAVRRTQVSLEVARGLQQEYENASFLPNNIKTEFVSAADLKNGSSPGMDATCNVAILIRSIPKNRSAEDAMAGNTIESLTWPLIPPFVPNSNYGKGTYVTSTADASGNTIFLCSASIVNALSLPKNDVAHWNGIAAVPTPIVVPLDGWGKGLRFVGGGLTDLRVDPNGTKGWIGTAAPPTGYTTLRPALTSPNGRPYWVSAGPDGDFTTQDDNVYSFEN